MSSLAEYHGPALYPTSVNQESKRWIDKCPSLINPTIVRDVYEPTTTTAQHAFKGQSRKNYPTALQKSMTANWSGSSGLSDWIIRTICHGNRLRARPWRLRQTVSAFNSRTRIGRGYIFPIRSGLSIISTGEEMTPDNNAADAVI